MNYQARTAQYFRTTSAAKRNRQMVGDALFWTTVIILNASLVSAIYLYSSRMAV